ncbi:DNA-3-methyladenine glycosylase [Lactiplantibacillus plantarum]|nr:DNA-3-methyladenine glycosylase [Lactiplantibacillus plantarum]
MTAIERFLSTRTTPEIAASLLGKQLHLQTSSGVLTAWITETEAYLGARDAGAHAYQNHQTPRNRALWQSAGTIYIYQMRAWCLLNIVTQAAGTPECVLIRGIEPDVGLERMQQQRPVPIANLTNGPGKLMQALGLDKTLNGQTLQPATLSLDLSHYRQPEQVMRLRELELSTRVNGQRHHCGTLWPAIHSYPRFLAGLSIMNIMVG